MEEEEKEEEEAQRRQLRQLKLERELAKQQLEEQEKAEAERDSIQFQTVGGSVTIQIACCANVVDEEIEKEIVECQTEKISS
jgi:DNA-binding protein YbaB